MTEKVKVPGFEDLFVKDFDPQQFYDNIYSTLLSMQSDYGVIPNNIVSSPSDLPASKQGEGLVNTFYRLIGMPAVRDNEALDNLTSAQSKILSAKDQAVFTKSIADIKTQGSTLNYFSINSIRTAAGYPDITMNALTAKEGTIESLTKNIKNRVLDYYVTMYNWHDIVDGTSPVKPSIFPSVVVGDVPVFPKRKRLAPAFFDGDYLVTNGARCSRPFIEHIIWMRIFALSGANTEVKTQLQQVITADINAVFPNGNSDNPQSTLVKDVEQFNILELQITAKLLNALLASSSDYAKTVKDIQNLSQQTLFVPTPKASVLEKTGSHFSTYAEAYQFLKDNQIDGPTPLIDYKIADTQQRLSAFDAFLQIIPSNQVLRSDERRREADLESTSSHAEDVFLPEFLDICTSGIQQLETTMAQLKQQKQNAIGELERARVRMLIYTGHYNGLSIFDILSVFLALFTINLSDLFGLLNQDAQDRLLKSSFLAAVNNNSQPQSFNEIFALRGTANRLVAGSPNSVDVALKNFEIKVKDYLQVANAEFHRKL